jgi:ribonuclease HI
VRDPAGKIVLELAKRLGRETNNVAEYYALLAALDYSAAQGMKALRIRSDSELLVRQMQGRYKVKSADLKPLYERAVKLAHQLIYFRIEHVPREQNRDADALANLALDSGDAVNQTSSALQVKEKKSIAVQSEGETPAKRIRARFANGVLVPLEAVSLSDGAEVIVDIRIPRRN